MTAAVYSARKKINTLLIAREVGGQVMWTSTIENYMGYQLVAGSELMEKFEAQIAQFPIERKEGEEIVTVGRVTSGFEVITKSGDKFQARSIIIATGKKPRRLGVPGETEFTGRGVSYCSVCDGPLFAGEKVAVVGGGNSALEALDDLVKIADAVYSITEMGFTGDAILSDRVIKSPILQQYHNYSVVSITGNEMVTGIQVRDNKSGKETQLAVKGVFIEIGLIPNSDLVKGFVGLNRTGEIVVNCNSETEIPGLFAAGDVASTPEKQIIIASGEGAKAALQAHRYLQRLTG